MSEIVICGIPFDTDRETEALQYAKSCGFTSVQIYTHWRDFEPERRGSFCWDTLDRQVARIRDAGLKYVPFLLLGPKYSAPAWWLADPGHRGLVCLEHGRECPVESVWNPAFREEASRVTEAFAAHYLPWGVLESVQPGIGGDYGEAIYPVLGNWPGDYHTHEGFWCAGDDAIEDLRRCMRRQYGDIASLNAAWRTAYASFDEVAPFAHHRRPSRTAYLDLMRWYMYSMTNYADFWMTLCRRCFPETPVYLCTGGEGQAAIGAHFSEQARIAARSAGGIRLTNEGNDFQHNFQTSVLFHSACAHYGAYLGLEPVGPMLPHGVVNRIFGSTAYGNRQIFHYYSNLVDDAGRKTGAGELVKRYAPLIAERPADSGIALFWPVDETWLENAPVPKATTDALAALRTSYEIGVTDEDMILSGALERLSILVMLDVPSTRGAVLEAIARWVEGGGVLLTNCRALDTERRPVAAFDAMLGLTPQSQEAWGHTVYRVVPVAWAPRFSSVDSVHSSVAWMHLNDKVSPLLQSDDQLAIGDTYIRRAYAAYEYRRGKGRVVYYAAALNLDTPEDAVFTPSPAFRYLLEDCCRAFGHAEPHVLEDGEIARADIGGCLLRLLKSGEILEA